MIAQDVSREFNQGLHMCDKPRPLAPINVPLLMLVNSCATKLAKCCLLSLQVHIIGTCGAHHGSNNPVKLFPNSA